MVLPVATATTTATAAVATATTTAAAAVATATTTAAAATRRTLTCFGNGQLTTFHLAAIHGFDCFVAVIAIHKGYEPKTTGPTGFPIRDDFGFFDIAVTCESLTQLLVTHTPGQTTDK